MNRYPCRFKVSEFALGANSTAPLEAERMGNSAILGAIHIVVHAAGVAALDTGVVTFAAGRSWGSGGIESP